MSHSQFHSTNLFILRHAWLNLWDKHMTTGRINQVTTFQKHRLSSESTKLLGGPRRATFLSAGVHFSFSRSNQNFKNPLKPGGSTPPTPQGRNRLVPRSHISSDALASLSVMTKKSWPSERTTLRPAKQLCCCSPGHGGFPSVLIASSLAISK